VLSQPRIAAESLADYLSRRPEMAGEGEGVTFLTSGRPRQVSDQATRFLRRSIDFQAG
jgi:glutamate racemase